MENYNRRQFIKTSGAASLVSALPGTLVSKPNEDTIWANLLHLSFNMWEDWSAPGKEMRYYRPYLRFDEKLWNDLLIKMETNRLDFFVYSILFCNTEEHSLYGEF